MIVVESNADEPLRQMVVEEDNAGDQQEEVAVMKETRQAPISHNSKHIAKQAAAPVSLLRRPGP